MTAALYYEGIGSPIIPSIINWARIRQFRSYTTSCEEWEDPADLPACSKDVSIIQLLELVTEHIISKLGVRKIPLSYVTRTDTTVLTIGTISKTFPYSEGVDSFHEELITRAYHNHLNFSDNNGIVLYVLVACLKTTMHMSDLKTFQKRVDGRGALVINSSWKEYTPSEYGKVAEIVPIVGTVGSTLVTYDSGILQTPNLLLRCSVTSSSICMMDTSLLHAGRSAGSYQSSHDVVYDLNCLILVQFMILGTIGRLMSS